MAQHPKRWKLWNSGNPTSYVLAKAGVRLATAQQTRDGKWFVYGSGFNTASNPVDSLDDAKRLAQRLVAFQ